MTPEAFCRRILPEVSRTFALNIPVLPAPLDLVVTVAYLLCRIADAIEDESAAPPEVRAEQLAVFRALLEGPDAEAGAERFAKSVLPTLRASAPAAEVELLRGTPEVIRAYLALPSWTHRHLARCLKTMTEGMSAVAVRLGAEGFRNGLPDLEATLEYCYYVAGTVGEMLTALFIGFAPEVAERADRLEPRAVAFARTLQLTNILKDVREDLERGSCWLPRTRMEAHQLSPGTLLLEENRARAVGLLDELVEVTRKEANEAFEYCLALPGNQPGIRLFCLWPLFFAVSTLKALEHNPDVFEPTKVKIARLEVQNVMLRTQERVGSDDGLRALYRECA